MTFQNNPSKEEVHFLSNQGRQDGFLKTYQNSTSKGWRNNQNQSFGWKQDVGPSNREGMDCETMDLIDEELKWFWCLEVERGVANFQGFTRPWRFSSNWRF